MQVYTHTLEGNIFMLVPKKSRNSMKEAEVLSVILFPMLCAHRQCWATETEGKEIPKYRIWLAVIFSNSLILWKLFCRLQRSHSQGLMVKEEEEGERGR